ncbi:RNA polymerase sigma factor [Hyunsoonleella sp. 2307UL5-6]|uniref:RNA polymerase sigma factor n=1 Tax=Hyunsoonleella sp. 2307UL5-6 TaxID=3384768 RepID=UPI0039BD3D90
MTDEQIIEKIKQNGNTELFGIIYDRFSQRIYNKCYSFVKNEDEAKDLTHDIFLKIYVSVDKFNGTSKFSTWVYSLVYNHCINYVNRCPVKKHETPILDFFEIPVFTEDFELEILKKDITNKKLHYVLDNLSPLDKSILLLKYDENLTIKDIKAQLNISTSAVKMRIKRAKERFSHIYNSTTCVENKQFLSAS